MIMSCGRDLPLKPLAAGFIGQPASGLWRCHSLFKQAINLQHTSGELLTLIRGTASLPPMGWLLRKQDFAWLSERIKPQATLTIDYDGLHYQELQVDFPPRHIVPALPVRLSPLAPWLNGVSAASGLCGALNHALLAADQYQQALTDALSGWMQGKSPQLAAQIGLGPGLTPAADDMLVGALSVLFCQPVLRAHLYHCPFLPERSVLNTLTTTVSACYLYLAGIGRFSVELIQLLRCLASPGQRIRPLISQFLARGHTSGADTLLGICIAQRWLEQGNADIPSH